MKYAQAPISLITVFQRRSREPLAKFGNSCFFDRQKKQFQNERKYVHANLWYSMTFKVWALLHWPNT